MVKNDTASVAVYQFGRLCQYLPAMLWSAHDDRQLLARLLLVFEKIVMGLDDQIPIESQLHRGYSYKPLEQTIAEMPSQFDPWQTGIEPWHENNDRSFLDYLAEWVGLSLDRENWSEYQQRRLLANMSNIYRLKGQKAGLYTYLDIYTRSTGKARIVIDDGVSVVLAAMQDSGMAKLYDFAFTQDAADGKLALVDPVAIAIGKGAGYLVIADRGRKFGKDQSEDRLQTAIWTIPIVRDSGAKPTTAQSILPVLVRVRKDDGKLAYPELVNPQGLVVDKDGRYYVVDQRSGDFGDEVEPKACVYRFTQKFNAQPSEYTQETIYEFDASKLRKEKGIVHPVSMVSLSAGSSLFLIVLDRGAHLGETAPPAPNPKLVIIRLLQDSSGKVQEASDENVVAVPLKDIKEPTALAGEVVSKGEDTTVWRLIIVDAGGQVTDGTERALVPDLIRITMTIDNNTPMSKETTPRIADPDAILKTLPLSENPLIFPTDIVVEAQNSFLVCDRGMKYARPSTDDPGVRTIARQPSLYRVRLMTGPDNSASRWTISRISQGSNLVDPAKMAFDAEKRELYLADPGIRYLNASLPHDWRLYPHEFGVLVNFSTVGGLQAPERRRIVDEIRRIVTEEKPAHSLFWLHNS